MLFNCLVARGYTGDEVNGLSVSVRERGDDIIQIWNKDARLADKSRIVDKVRELLPTSQVSTMFYKGISRSASVCCARGG